MDIDNAMLDEAIEREIARRSLHEFIQYINPEYITSDFSRQVCKALDEFLIDMIAGERPILIKLMALRSLIHSKARYQG